MRLVLSSAAAPGRALDELLDAAERKALAGLELEAGHGWQAPGIPAAGVEAEAAVEARGLVLAGVRVPAWGAPPVPTPARAPLLLPASTAGLREGAAVLEAGGRVLFAFDAVDAGALDAVDALRARYGERVGFAWEARPCRDPGAALLGEFLDRTGAALRHVRLFCAGPEGGDPEGGSVGALLGRLAVGRFGGTCALAPGGDDFLPLWDAWLGRRRGWGCNGDRPVEIRVGAP